MPHRLKVVISLLTTDLSHGKVAGNGVSSCYYSSLIYNTWNQYRSFSASGCKTDNTV